MTRMSTAKSRAREIGELCEPTRECIRDGGLFSPAIRLEVL